MSEMLGIVVLQLVYLSNYHFYLRSFVNYGWDRTELVELRARR